VTFLVLIGPMIAIWALNTLFGLNIEVTFWTWLAAAILVGGTSCRCSK
jgi:hypothetical protein